MDDLPYGEELIRTRDLPDKLTYAIKNLERISKGAILIANVPKIFEESLSIIEDSRSTLDDCTPLPSEDEDEDEDEDDF